jgi:hypothetical protein
MIYDRYIVIDLDSLRSNDKVNDSYWNFDNEHKDMDNNIWNIV